MLEVYVEYVVGNTKKNMVMANICFSTEDGKETCIKITDNIKNVKSFISKCLAKYSSGMYSKDKNEFIPQCDVTENMQGYVPYHLNYCPEYVDRECGDYSLFKVSGYRFGSLNPIYGGKVSANVMDTMYSVNDGLFCTSIAVCDKNDVDIDVYSIESKDKNVKRNEFVLEVVKEIANGFIYLLDEGYWDINTDTEPNGRYYGIDLHYDESEILDYDYLVDGEE